MEIDAVVARAPLVLFHPRGGIGSETGKKMSRADLALWVSRALRGYESDDAQKE